MLCKLLAVKEISPVPHRVYTDTMGLHANLRDGAPMALIYIYIYVYIYIYITTPLSP